MISIIIPIYNAQRYIKRCIDSILEQSFTDYEVILVDDGSVDDSLSICKKYESLDDRIHVIHQNNSGVSAARNAGIMVAKGTFLTFVDSDDWIAPAFLNELYMSAQEHDAQIVFCSYKEVHSIDDVQNGFIKGEIQCFEAKEAINYFGQANLERKSAHFRSPWAKLIKRELVLNKLFPTDRVYAEDGACVYLWLWQAEKIVYIDLPLYYYFQNEEGICHKPLGLHVIGNFLTESEWILFFKRHDFPDLYRGFCRRYIEDTLWAYDNSGEMTEKKIFRKFMRKALLKYRKAAGMDFKSSLYYYEIAWPVVAKLYWFLKK